MTTVRLSNISVSYAGERAGTPVPALDGVDCTARGGLITTIVGPSGAGKSTLLRLIAGLERSSQGDVYFDGDIVTTWPPGRRDVAMSFQRPALFPARTVFENVGFGLRLRQTPQETIRSRVESVARTLELEPLLERRAAALSGGEQQRVALGRALVHTPRVFLLDEPMSQLDAPLRRRVRSAIRSWQRETGATMIVVTHDQTDALAIGDRVAMFDDGKLIQVGTPDELYREPVNVAVARFIGNPGMNVLRGTVRKLDHAVGVELDRGQWLTLSPEVAATVATELDELVDSPVRVGFRAEDARVARGGPLRGRVTAREFAGTQGWLSVAIGEEKVQEIIVAQEHDAEDQPEVGTTVSIDVAAAHLRLFHIDSPGVRLGSVPRPSTT